MIYGGSDFLQKTNNMNFAQSLDRYLTTPPEDAFDDFYTDLAEQFSEEFWACAELWYEQDVAQRLVMKIYQQGGVELAYFYRKTERKQELLEHYAKVIERIYSLYKLWNNVRN